MLKCIVNIGDKKISKLDCLTGGISIQEKTIKVNENDFLDKITKQ